MEPLPSKLNKSLEAASHASDNKEQSATQGLLDLSRLRMTQDFGSQAGVKKRSLPYRYANPTDKNLSESTRMMTLPSRQQSWS